MIDDEIPSNDILARPNIHFTEPSQMATVVREDDIKDVNDDDIGTKMNRQVPLEELNPPRTRLNYD
jgi:hypothetical protein